MQDENLNAIRHSISHLMSMVIQKKYPKVGLGVGPFIENGFYQDYDLPDSISPDYLLKLEKEIKKLIKQNIKFEQHNMSFDNALKLYKHDPYKTEMIKDLKKKGEKDVSFYKSDWFENLCAGPHVKSTKEINPDAFKLTKIAGAYWKGDEKNKMLTRIYGVAFNTKKELDDYLKLQEEAEKRDHRKLGKELDLFSLHEEAPGMPFWHDKGKTIFELLVNRWRRIQKNHNYSEVACPNMLDISMWKQSGHYNHFKDEMFFIKADKGEKEMALRPMDCPGSILIYKEKIRSYKDFPLRMSELGTVFRNEKSGELHGLMRVQHVTQDDAHIYITEDMIEKEVTEVLKILDEIYDPFSLKTIVYLSTMPDKAMGDKKTWEKAEKALRMSLKSNKLDYSIKEGEGAFYGPKIDIDVEDSLGRSWQLGTIQLDFFMPKQFKLKYIDDKGKEQTPVMIHRALQGSLERFIGILIEHYAGAFPVWLSPVQVAILPVGATHKKVCEKLAEELHDQEIRVELFDDNETIGNRIRKASKEKIPYILVIGDKEAKSSNLAIRERGKEKVFSKTKKQFIDLVKNQIAKKK